jgi:hypothetical protein
MRKVVRSASAKLLVIAKRQTMKDMWSAGKTPFDFGHEKGGRKVKKKGQDRGRGDKT